MAKSKHSTALFEVINSAKKPERVAQSLRTPKWWFKSSHSAASSQSTAASAPAPAEPAYHEPEPPVAARYEPADPPAPRRSTYARGQRSSAVNVGYDADRKEFTFKLRYTTALVSAFVVFAVVGLSYVIGRHLGGGPRVADAQQVPVRQLLQQPPQPGVTAVAPKAKAAATPKTAAPAPSDSTTRAPLANTTTPRAQLVTSLVPASADTSLPRKVGLNYLVIHIYPPDRRKQAEAARDYFTKAGIPCSLESTSWTGTTGWMTLIGTAGFSRIKTDDFQAYSDQVAKLAKAYKTSQFDHPGTELHAYKWLPSDKPFPSN